MTADSTPPAIDLAREPDFAIGEVKVRPSLRQAGEETLEPRVMQVLVALSARRGDVVSRDELIQRCWDGRIVGDDAITRCIGQVRKLGEHTGAFAIETIARVGYRLVEAAPPALDPKAPSPEPPGSPTGHPGLLAKPAILIGLAAAAAAAMLLVILLAARGGAGQDLDAAVARITEALQKPTASPRDLRLMGDAVKSLGRSGRAEERSAFEALASNDSRQALDVLEGLAASLEEQADRKAAAGVYTKIGAIALLSDAGRGLRARRKAFELDPTRLAGFQGLFLDTMSAKGAAEAIAIADQTLLTIEASPRMRGWILAHRALAESDGLWDNEKAKATLLEIEALRRTNPDIVLDTVLAWIPGLIALNSNEPGRALDLAQGVAPRWSQLPERVMNASEVTLARALFDTGAWAEAFETSLASLNRRSREGDFLPSPMIEVACQAGMFVGRTEEAAPFCETLARRPDGAAGGFSRMYVAMMAAGRGRADEARSEFASAEVLLPARGSPRVLLMLFETWASARAGDLDRAEQLASKVVNSKGLSSFVERRRAIAAMAQRVLAEGLLAAGEKARACAPLAGAEQVYREIGGTAGAQAMRSLGEGAGCP